MASFPRCSFQMARFILVGSLWSLMKWKWTSFEKSQCLGSTSFSMTFAMYGLSAKNGVLQLLPSCRALESCATQDRRVDA